MMNGGNVMDKPLVTIEYKTADGSRICVEVSTSVKELLEQSDRQIRSQRRQDRRHISYMDFMDGLADAAMIDPQTDIADLFIRMESYERLYSALAKLSVLQRRRLRLYFVHNLTHRQIAELEGVNQSAIGSAIKRAIIQLQKYIID
jgi:RNA polymerase sigma factor (sigma-70 family)